MSCPSVSTLVACGEDGDCEGEGDRCVAHTYEARGGESRLQGLYCASEAVCGTELEDAGRTLYVDCPPLSELTSCNVAEGCVAETEICAPYTIRDEGGAESVDGYYCADESECYETIVDLGK